MNAHWPNGLLIAALALALILPASAGPARAETGSIYLPLVLKVPTGRHVQVSGRVLLEGRDDYSGTILRVDGVAVARTDASGHFGFGWTAATAATATITLTAECPGYLWAETTLHVDRATTLALPDVCLFGGDVAGPDSSLVTPAGDCPSTDPVPVPGPPDGQINIFDLTVVSQHQGVNNTDRVCGPGHPCWGPDPCYPQIPYLGYRADINGDGRVDGQDMAMVIKNTGLEAPLPWVACPQ